MRKQILLILVFILLMLSACKSVQLPNQTNSSPPPEPSGKAAVLKEQKSKVKSDENHQDSEFKAFVDNKADGFIATVSGDKNTIFLVQDYPWRTISKVDLPSNRGVQVYKCPANTDIMSVRTNWDGSKLFIREAKISRVIKDGNGTRGMSKVDMEYHSWVLDLNTGRKAQINQALEAWWSPGSDVLYGITGQPYSDMNLVEYNPANYSPRVIKTFSQVNLQFQSAPADKTVFLADNKGEMGVTLMRIDLRTGKTVYSKKTGRMPMSTDTCAVVSGSGDRFFWSDELTEKTYLTDIKSQSTKTVFTKTDIREIKWLPGDQKAIFRLGDPSRGGNWAAVIKIYDIESNTFKQIKSVNVAMGGLFYSPASKRLYYSYIEGGNPATLEGGKRLTTFWALDI